MSIDPVGYRFLEDRKAHAFLNAKGNRANNVNSFAVSIYLREGGASDRHLQAVKLDRSRNCVAHNERLQNAISKGHWSYIVPVALSTYVKGKSIGAVTRQIQAVLCLDAIRHGAKVPHYYQAVMVADTLAAAKAGETRMLTRQELVAWMKENRTVDIVS